MTIQKKGLQINDTLLTKITSNHNINLQQITDRVVMDK